MNCHTCLSEYEKLSICSWCYTPYCLECSSEDGSICHLCDKKLEKMTKVIMNFENISTIEEWKRFIKSYYK